MPACTRIKQLMHVHGAIKLDMEYKQMVNKKPKLEQFLNDKVLVLFMFSFLESLVKLAQCMIRLVTTHKACLFVSVFPSFLSGYITQLSCLQSDLARRRRAPHNNNDMHIVCIDHTTHSMYCYISGLPLP